MSQASRRRPAEPAGPATSLTRLELGGEESSRGGAIRQGRRSLDDPVLRPLLRAVPDILKARRRNARKVRKAFATSRNRANQRRASHARWPPEHDLSTQEGPAGALLSSSFA